MLDPNLLRKNPNLVSEKLARRGFKLDVDKFLNFEKRRKILQLETENLQAERNLRSKLISQAKLRGKDIEQLRIIVNQLNDALNKKKIELSFLLKKIHNITLAIPNIPDDSVPIGKNENDNVELKRWGVVKQFDFEIRDHVTLGEMHKGLDFTSAAKMTGSRFVVMKGEIAHLHRILTQFMLDLHVEKHGYNEAYVPYLVNNASLYGTGQLPKFSDELFYTSSFEEEKIKNGYALIPTAEVPLNNLVRNKIIDESDLPIKLTAYSPCFRSEAGSYGRDTRGLVRMHQFDKVELVQIVYPEDSMRALEEITVHAEKVLELLELPYRRVLVCTGNMGFSACKTYDLEVWVPSKRMYCEISSCSNVWDFQARRLQARVRSKSKKQFQLVHNLNASALAVGRTLMAVLENYQQIDGCIEIPKVLRPYMKGKECILMKTV